MNARNRRGGARGEDYATQLAEVATLITALKSTQKVDQGRQKTNALLESVTLGLYEELDKLSKKAPAEAVTDLALSEINQAIGDVKGVADDDPYIQRLNQFVAAGDNPENRDAVVVLRTLRQGLERLTVRLAQREVQIRDHLKSAHTIQAAIEIQKEGALVDADTLCDYVDDVDRRWINSLGQFNFTLLENTNLTERLAVD